MLLATGLSVAVWRRSGGIQGVGVATAFAVLALVVLVVGAAARWRPLRRRSAALSRLPLAVVLVAVAGVGLVCWRLGGPLAASALAARHMSLQMPRLAQGSRVYAADGSLLAVFHGADNRQPVPLSAVNPTMVHAVVDTEDARYWQHGGVDTHGIARAVYADLRAAGAQQGASTIAMQLAKNTLLAGRPDNLATKTQEAVLANRLEAELGKKAILSDYLNTVYFGAGAYGVQAAAQTYFGVSASQLDVAQAALLAGLIQDPSGYEPVAHPQAATTRRGEVLRLMVAAHDLTSAQEKVAAAAPLPTTLSLPPSGQNYFAQAVRQELLADPALGPTPQDRSAELLKGGLRIHTTLDPAVQQAATKAVQAGLPQSALHLSAALAAIDPATGHVEAVVGGPSYASAQFDAALAAPGRPTGSAFKVFTLVAALENGYSPSTLLDGSSPCSIPDPGNTPDPWVLANFQNENFGQITLTQATADSVNCAYARLAMKVGLDKIAHVAHQMGVQVPLAVVPSMTLGTNDVPPVQMASAYATLADGGVYHQPHLVTEVDRADGSVLFRHSSTGVRVMSAQTAATVTAILGQVVQKGTGTAAAVPGRQVVGKTGTGENYADAWFVGYTPQLAAAVWMGSPAGEVPMRDVGGINVTGGSYPAQMWERFVAAALAGQPPGSFPLPPPDLAAGGATPAAPGPGTTGPAATTQPTTWCWSSCGKTGTPTTAPPPAPHKHTAPSKQRP
ncbi:MAG TPA: transglycosylase domain-containing protein [Acidimicrobiales bacterium]|nr:transglycosylase domain-containing protein [Acidimicrobiales bacterium]